MNVHDPLVRPGAHLVAEAFGVDDPRAFSDGRLPHRPLDMVGRMVAEAAREVDELHGALTRAAETAIRVLEPISRGENPAMRGRNGTLHTTGLQIELLAGRRGAAYEQLVRAVPAYRRLAASPDAVQPERATAQAVREQAAPDVDKPSWGDDWAISGGRGLVALEAVSAGDVRFHLSPLSGDTWVSDSNAEHSAPRIRPETVEQLVFMGLLEKDVTESPYQPGQLVSLTVRGEAALRDGRAAAPRVSAALSRSSTAASAVPPPAAAAPPAGPVAARSRSL
ncbi:large ATP-binding protein [Streptantibioticus parmotrematis]|uniref:large ATP-binding protein n=1 Tax=Streptantibioticus parmotrematis TaxID=2873249 RepID=UPI0033C60859